MRTRRMAQRASWCSACATSPRISARCRRSPTSISMSMPARSWRLSATTAPASRRWSRSWPACTSRVPARSTFDGQQVVARRSERGAPARHRDGVPGPRALREPRRRRQHLSRPASCSPIALDEVSDGSPGLDAAQRTCGAHPERARADRVAFRWPAADGCDRPVAAARPRS